MVKSDTMPNPYLARFKELLVRSAIVAQQRIADEGPTTRISDSARVRAQNVLSYTLKDVEAWGATRDLLLAMAPKMELAGYRQEWLAYLNDGLLQSQQQGDQAAQATLQFQCGYLYRLLSNYAQAHALLSTSAVGYAALGDSAGQASALNQLAYLAWQQHQYEEVVKLAQQTLLLLTPGDLERATTLSVLGLVALDRSQWAEAEQYHKEALAIRTHYAQRRQMAWSLQNLAFALRGQQKYAIAIAYYQEAIAILEEVHDPANCAIARMNLGIVYYFREEFSQALENYKCAEVTFRQLVDDFNLGKLLTNQGLVYLKLQEWPQAESTFIESTTYFQKLTDRSWHLNALDGLGIAYLEQGFYDKALSIFESIETQLTEIVDTPAYHYLTSTLPIQFEQARSQIVKRGLSTWTPPKRND